MSSLKEDAEMFLMVARRHGSVDSLLESFFSFLGNYTDYFHIMESSEDSKGFIDGEAELKLQKIFLKEQNEYRQRSQSNLIKNKNNKNNKNNNDKKKTFQNDIINFKLEIDNSEDKKIKNYSPSSSQTAEIKISSSQKSFSDFKNENFNNENFQNENLKFDKLQTVDGPSSISLLNGGHDSNYYWNQNSSEINAEVILERNKNKLKNDLHVVLTKTSLKIQIKNNKNELLEYFWREEINPYESVWLVEEMSEDGSKVRLSLTLEKHIQDKYWDSLFNNSENKLNLKEIKATKDISELSEQAQSAIHKMMFDENQKRKGLLTSDQMNKKDVLKNAWDAEGSPFKGQPFDSEIFKTI